ncbi:MAG: Xaa-Pro dipeptidase, partial [Deltaproteobacteria bacterium]|nr:Xaa-Pro dipeptidase [Deltaproteobacteria bacterium]
MSYATTYPAHLEYLQHGYEAAMAEHGYDAVILCGGAAAPKSRFDDQSWPLCPTPAYAHWCPLVEADAFVVIRAGSRPTLVRTVVDDFWETTPPPESDHFWSGFTVVEVKPGMAGDVLPGGRVAVITRDQGTSPPGSVNPPALIAAIDLLRTKKTAYEIECLAEASRRAVLGHRHVAELFRTGTPSELDLHLAYLGASEQDEARAPYQNIVALGAHTAILHYVAYTRERITGDTSFLIDAGAKVLGYGSDITRTYVRGTESSAKRFAELLERVDACQQDIIRRIRPGLPYEDLHDEPHRLLAVALRDLGIGRGSVDELVSRGITRALFPHGLGHSLGITVHDAGLKPRPPRGENKFLRNTSVIEAGQVFTIEPGIYVIDGLLGPLQSDDRRELVDWSAIADFRRFGGIRIEDNVLVEASGTRNLTREAFA